MPEILTEAQIRQIELASPEGLTSQQLVAVFEDEQVRFSEANLRRYVQLGLVPRSRRVGQKGKNLGSKGLYPARSVRRINTIKKLMAENYTLEEIQARFLSFKDGIETLDEALGELLSVFEKKIGEQGVPEVRQRLDHELSSVRQVADQLMEAVARLEKILISSTPGPRPRGPGAALATELL
jgi:DNA-binding transcriptional MerR regulator